MKQSCFAALLLAAGTQAFVLPAGTRTMARRSATGSVRMSTVDAPPLDTPLVRRFGSLRGRDVKPVSESMVEFCQLYPKPILPQYRTLVNDLIQSTHLTVVDARFKYDAVFALGVHSVFFRLLRSYPGADSEAASMFNALVTCLDLDPAVIAADASALSTWAQTSSSAELEAALRGEGGSALAGIAQAARSDEFYLYSKMWGLGLVQLVEGVGAEATEERVEALVGLVGFSAVKPKQDLAQYKDVLSRSEQVEQLLKEIEIREKKKMADRLEEKARRALEAAKLAAEQTQEA